MPVASFAPAGTLILHVHRRWAAIRERGGITRLLRGYLDSVRSKECEFGDATYNYRGLDDMFMHRFGARELRRGTVSGGLEHPAV